MKKTINLSEVRIKIDQLNEEIISGLKHRSRFNLNKGTFEKEFTDGLTWFAYRLRAEQNVDSEFGRYLYPDQSPILFKKEDLAKAKKKRSIPTIQGLIALDIDVSNDIIKEYRAILESICLPGEDAESYGESVKLDVENVLACNERIVGIGKQVAEYKIEHDPVLATMTDKKAILASIVNLDREREAITKAVTFAEKINLPQPQAIGSFIQKLINLTKTTEVEYILALAKEKNSSITSTKKRS